MKKAWKIILIIALVVLILGEVALGVGLLMQGSPQTVWDTASDMFHFMGAGHRSVITLLPRSAENGEVFFVGNCRNGTFRFALDKGFSAVL